MCRWLAYAGAPIALSRIITRPDHSLIDQSRRALENEETTNGDGFGMGWYGEEKNAGRYRSTHPAWNDENLTDLAQHTHSRLFLAHIRASSGTPVQQTNCHPFSFENWLFQHNGAIPGFQSVKRQLLMAVEPSLFRFIYGSTDSELIFFLALSFGLRENVQKALETTIGFLEHVRQESRIKQALTLSAAACDGDRLYAVRYSSDGDSPTLYHSCHIHALRRLHGTYEKLPDDAIVVVSEPLDELTDHWEPIPESSFVMVEEGQITVSEFKPRSAGHFSTSCRIPEN